MLFVHAASNGWAGLDDDAVAAELHARAEAIARLRSSGQLIACSPLADPHAGREVRVRGGRTEVSPLTPSPAPIAGFYLIETSSLVEAEQLAASIPDSGVAHVSVRELMPLPGIPGEIPPPRPPEPGRD